MSTHKKMNPEVKKVWINELRSGRYKQTDGALRRDGRHCCLGVLCATSKAGKWEERGFGGEYRYGGATGFPPLPVIEWASLSRREMNSLAAMNDHGATFDEIADWIERHL